MSKASASIVGAILGAYAVGTVIGWYSPDDSIARNERATAIPATPPPQDANGTASDPLEFNPGESTGNFSERLKAVFAISNRSKRNRAVAVIADGLDVAQIREAIAKVEKIHGSDRREIEKRLYTRWAELDPEAAFRHAQTAIDSDVATGAAVKGWVSKGPAGARDAIAKMPDLPIRLYAVGGLIEALAETDPVQAFNLADKLGASSDSIELLFGKWTKKDPEEAAAYCRKGPYRRSAIESVVRAWAETDLPGAMRWLESLPEEDVAGGMGARSPFVLTLTKWMEEDTESAMRWLEERPADSQTSRMFSDLSTEVMFRTRDPLLSIKLLSKLSPSDERRAAWSNVMALWASDDLDSAVSWAEGQPEEVRHEALPGIATRLAETNPERALMLVTGLGGNSKGLLEQVMMSWASRQPAAAAAWLRDQPPNADAIAAVASQWAFRNAEEATEWINTIEDSPAKDDALSDVAERFISSHPEISAEWIAGIGDTKKREEAYKELEDSVHFWIDYNPTAVRKWLPTASLPEEMKSRLLAELKK